MYLNTTFNKEVQKRNKNGIFCVISIVVKRLCNKNDLVYRNFETEKSIIIHSS